MHAHVGHALPRIGRIQLPERDAGDAHLVAIGGAQKAQPEHLETVDRRHTVQVFVDGADQHLPPEAVDGVRRLPLLQQPVEHADAIQIFAPRAFPPQRHEGARDGELVGATEALHPQEGFGEVQRRGQASALQHGDPAARLDEIKLAIEAYAFPYPQPLVEIEQIDAAAQKHVLAVIDGLGNFFAARRERRKTSRGRPGTGRASKRSTSQPSRPRAAAAASPASPPPAINTFAI